MSDLVGNPEDRISRVAAHTTFYATGKSRNFMEICTKGKVKGKKRYKVVRSYINSTPFILR